MHLPVAHSLRVFFDDSLWSGGLELTLPDFQGGSQGSEEPRPNEDFITSRLRALGIRGGRLTRVGSAARLHWPWLCIECTTCWLCGINWRLRLFGYCTRKAEAEVYKAFHAIFETECAKEGIVFEINDPELPLGSSTRH